MSSTAKRASVNIKSVGIIVTVAVFCFLVGGGWRLLFEPDFLYGIFYHTETVHERLCAYLLAFTFGGGLATTIGTGITLTVLVLKQITQKEKS